MLALPSSQASCAGGFRTGCGTESRWYSRGQTTRLSLHSADMGNTFVSVFIRDIRRYWLLVAAIVVLWGLLEHWAFGRVDEYIGSHIAVTVQRINAFLHFDVATLALGLTFVAIVVHAALNARRTAPEGQIKTFEIRFDYLPGNMLDNGWVRPYLKEADAKPKATLAPDAPVAGSIIIDVPEGHAFEYQLPRNVRMSDRLIYTARYFATTMIFTRLELSSIDGTQTVQKLIKYELGTGSPYPTKGCEEREYTLPLAGEPVKNQWRRFEIALPEAVARTWGKHGLVFKGVTGFLVRSTIGISPIEFYELRKPS